MTLAGDSITRSPSGAGTVATHTVSSKEHQVMMFANANGHLVGTNPPYQFVIATQVHVNSANTVHWDLFNADATLLVRVISIRQIPNFTTTVNGVIFNWLLERTTDVGTTGTTITAWLPDTSYTALDADITCRSKPGGGATQSTDLFNYALDSEESAVSTVSSARQGGLELIPPLLSMPGSFYSHGILLRQNQGLRCVQVTASAAGNTGWVIGFTVE